MRSLTVRWLFVALVCATGCRQASIPTFGFPMLGREGGIQVMKLRQTPSSSKHFRFYDTVWNAFNETGRVRFTVRSNAFLFKISWSAEFADADRAGLLFRRIQSALDAELGPDSSKPKMLGSNDILRTEDDVIYRAAIREDTVSFVSTWYGYLQDVPR